MFDNIIAQDAALQLNADLHSRRLAPAMLFYGPPASGKGSTALELARALSCEAAAAWNCSCPACTRHRFIVHTDLLCMGKRAFSGEIAASRAAFIREPFAPSSPILFIRSVRKLLSRFSPVLWEDDSRLGKIRPVLASMEEGLAEFESLASVTSGSLQSTNLNLQATGKLCESIIKNALVLETDYLSEAVPVAQIRRAAYWSRLAPAGKRKTLLIENAGKLQDAARNSLLKILEEPPDTITVIISAERRQHLMPTMLSRLRPYRFLKRDRDKECEVIRRVFRDGNYNSFSGLTAYLNSFGQSTKSLNPNIPADSQNQGLPDSAELPAAAFFIACVARTAAVSFRKKDAEIPPALNALGSLCAPLAETAGFKKVMSAGEACNEILEKSAGFENLSFSQFIKTSLELVSLAMRRAGVESGSILYNDIWRKNASESESAVSVFNQNPALALEALFYRLKKAMSGCIDE
jgi:DNA polymerase-3 subunit gamma/tau